VERDHGPQAEGSASFRTTRWTIVMRAAQSQAPGGHSALAQLYRNCWYPLFARRRGQSLDDAQDLTKGFFLHLLEQRALAGVGRTVSEPAEIDEEIHTLCDALIASEGRLSP
jgi:hypothetical protein